MIDRCETEEFKKGSLEGVSVVEGELVLSEKTEGYWISSVHETAPFQTLIVSFNADIPEETDVEIKASVRVDGRWSLYFSYGRFSPYILRAGTVEEDGIARMKKEQITVKEGMADAYRLCAVLRSDKSGITPFLRLLTATQNPFLSEQKNDEESFIETPVVSQLERSANMAQVICSTTSVTMLLNRFGEDILPEETALFDYDHVFRGNGNWVYSCAIAGCYGYEAYVEYTDINGIKAELAKGYPVVARVRYSPVYNMGAEEDIPYMGNTPGLAHAHLIAVVGFTVRKGVEYLIVQDPYAVTKTQVRRLFRVSEFVNGCWNHIIYKIHEKRQNKGRGCPVRIQAELKKVGPFLYELWEGDRKIDLGPYFIGSQKYPKGAIVIIPKDEAAKPICNRTAYFTDTDADGKIFIDDPCIAFSDQRKDFSVYVVSVYGKTWVASYRFE